MEEFKGRITRDQMFMAIANIVSFRSTCLRAKVGAVIVQDNRIVSTGYVGAPSGLPHCLDVGCEIGPDGGCIRTVHAEVNAIAFAARAGIKLEGSTLYVTMSPCLNCAKLIINAGIREVVYRDEYRDPSGLKLLRQAGIEIYKWPRE